MNEKELNAGSDLSFARKNKIRSIRRRHSPHLHTLHLAALSLTVLTLAATVFAATATHAGGSPRIVGGSPVNNSAAQATVALLGRSRVELDGDLFQAQGCGGTVIGTRWVLTAAHCVIDNLGKLQANDVMVLMGSLDLSDPETQPVGVTQIITHESYTSVQNGFDIALLRLESNALVTPAQLDTTPVSQNELAYVAGWGSVTSGAAQMYSPRLRGAFVNLTPGENCYAYPFTDDSFICAKPTSGVGGTCDGDSGGPLYRITGEGLPIKSLIGITSFRSVRDACRGTGDPAGYTNVAAYADWIRENTGITAPRPPAPEPARNTGIQLEGEGWWQIQRTSDYSEVYQGRSEFVPLPAGTYNVINFTTGVRTTNVRVTANSQENPDPSNTSDTSNNPDAPNTPDTAGERKGINLVGEGWWQIQDSFNFEEFYQGRSAFVTLPPGTYIVTNLTTGSREEAVAVR